MAVATVPARSATPAPVRLLYSLAQYTVDMGGNIREILGNPGQSGEIPDNFRKSGKFRPALRIGSSGSRARRYNTIRPPRRFPAPPRTPSHGCGRFLPSKSMYMNDIPLNLHFPYFVMTYPSRSMSGVIAITLYGVPLTSSPLDSPSPDAVDDYLVEPVRVEVGESAESAPHVPRSRRVPAGAPVRPEEPVA